MQRIYPDLDVETWIVWSEDATVEPIGADARNAVIKSLIGAGAP